MEYIPSLLPPPILYIRVGMSSAVLVLALLSLRVEYIPSLPPPILYSRVGMRVCVEASPSSKQTSTHLLLRGLRVLELCEPNPLQRIYYSLLRGERRIRSLHHYHHCNRRRIITTFFHSSYFIIPPQKKGLIVSLLSSISYLLLLK